MKKPNKPEANRKKREGTGRNKNKLDEQEELGGYGKKREEPGRSGKIRKETGKSGKEQEETGEKTGGKTG